MCSSIFDADGVKHAMRKSYEKHVKHYPNLHPNDLNNCFPPHQFGLYGTLNTRLMVSGLNYGRKHIEVEVAPFLLMKPNTPIKAIDDYIAFKEDLLKDLDFLRLSINEVLMQDIDENKIGSRLCIAG